MFRSAVLALASLCFVAQKAIATTTQVHDAAFVPDEVFIITEQNMTIGCGQQSAVAVNGTSPGPVLRLKEGQTTWIRVYNNMADKNFTMVSICSGGSTFLMANRIRSTGTVWRRPRRPSPMAVLKQPNGPYRRASILTMSYILTWATPGRTFIIRMFRCRRSLVTER